MLPLGIDPRERLWDRWIPSEEVCNDWSSTWCDPSRSGGTRGIEWDAEWG
jgi:hypothetical protein